MKLTITSTSGIAALWALSVSAASLPRQENNKGSSSTTAAKKQGIKCTFANNSIACNIGEVCVKDPFSNIGGRCELLASASDDAAVLEPRRIELCEKCVGSFACANVADKSKIGCGSCLGDYACRGLSSDVTIGDGSCL
eukprot:scaffold30456_cov66-Cyclotella_meneghiniana.AAC.4